MRLCSIARHIRWATIAVVLLALTGTLLLPLASASTGRVATLTPQCHPPSASTAIVRRAQIGPAEQTQQPQSLAVDVAHGRLYAVGALNAVTTTAVVSEIDICTGLILAQRRFPGYSGLVALDAARNVAAVVIEGDKHSALHVLNATTLAPEYSVGLPASSFVLALDRADGRVAVSNGDHGLLLLDEGTGRLIRALPLRYLINGAPFYGSVLGIAIDERRHRLAFVADNATGGILDARTGTIVHSFALAGQPDGVAMDPLRGQTILIYSGDLSHPNRMVFLDTVSGRLLARFVLPGDPSTLVFDARTRHVFVALRLPNDDQGLALVDADAHRLLHLAILARTNGSAVHFAASNLVLDAAHQRLYVGVDGPTRWSDARYVGLGRLFVVDTHTGHLVSSVLMGHNPQLLALDAPAGRLVVGDADNDSLTYLATARLGGTPPTIVIGPVAPTCHPYTAQIHFAPQGALRPPAQGTAVAPQRTGPYLGFIAAGPQGALWFTTVHGVGKITTAGRITRYRMPATVPRIGALTTGSGGMLWFATTHGLGYINGQEQVVTAVLPLTDHAQVQALTWGMDQHLWLSESDSGPDDRVLRVSPAGALQAFCLLNTRAAPLGISTGPDGNEWVTETGADRIARVTPTGQVTEFALGPVDNSQPGFIAHYVEYIAPGSQGNLWFTEFARRVGRITTTGRVTIVHLSSSLFNQGVPFDITTGPAGSDWFTELYSNDVARISTQGTVTEYPLSTPNAGPFGIAAGPDGNLWVTETCANAIARVTVTGQVTEYPLSATEHGTGSYCLESP